MKCPRCQVLIAIDAVNCPSCGFDSAASAARHGSHWVRLERLTDAAHCLRLSDKQEIENALDDFERRFPQIFFAVYLGVLPTSVTVSEVGFWLLNHAAFGTNNIYKRNEFGIVLAIDPAAGSAAISMGYSLEALGPGLDVRAVLAKIKSRLASSDYAAAIRLAVKSLDGRLRSCGKPARHSPSSLPAVCDDLGVIPLKYSKTRQQTPVSDGA